MRRDPLLPTSMAKEQDRKKRVLVVGAGAAGMSCAHHLAEHTEKFDVTLIDAVDYCGGQAFSIPIDKDRHGASWLNQGVQGGSPIFHHTMTMFARQGHHADPVKLQVAFGKGDQFWSNVYPTKHLANNQAQIKRFVRMLSIVRWFEVFFALLPIKYLMKLFRFDEVFANTVALPMVALFLGTGNYTPEVPAMIMERLSTSETYQMWYPPDKLSIASNLPPMVVFPNFSVFYDDWRKSLEKKGVKVRLSTELTRVMKRDSTGVVVRTISRTAAKDSHNPNSACVTPDPSSNADADKQESEEEYDELVLCVLADAAKRILATTISTRESKVLGSAKFANDITVTHHDADYIRKHYELSYNSEQAVSSLSGEDQSKRIDFAKKSFRPMYLIRPYQADLTKLDLCFDCTNYQGQFPPEVDVDNHVFQTIFLNKERDGHMWDLHEIDESKIIRKDWWHQLCHSWTHYAFVVPCMWLLQGRKHTRFAASWTLVNAHEVACISGISAAVSLGADYPHDLERDKWAFLCFRLYYMLVYGKWYRRKATATAEGMTGEGSAWATDLNGSVYSGPGVATEERTIWKAEKEAGRSL